MPGIFTFIGQDFDGIFRQDDIFLPGIGKVIGIYHSTSEKELRLIKRAPGGQPELEFEDILASRENQVIIQKLRDKSIHYEWVDQSDLPFDEEPPARKEPRIKQQDIFDELQKVVLLLRFRSESDAKYDLIIIYFNKDKNNFGISRGKDVLSTEMKTAIGHVLYHYFKSVISQNRQNSRILRSVQDNIRGIIRRNAELEEELQLIRKNHGDSLVGLCHSYLQELSQKYDRRYILSDDAIEKIRNYQGNIRHLFRIMENAVSFMENMAFGSTEDTMKLQAYALNFDEVEVSTTMDDAVKRIDSRESKTMLLLDKFENAALALSSKKVPLTGINIGRALPTPISAPAITDALKKHRKQILQLFEKYPEKWETIRKNFRPVRNLAEKHGRDKIREESA